MRFGGVKKARFCRVGRGFASPTLFRVYKNLVGEFMSRLRMAVIGVGHLGQHHARILADMPDVDLVGVVDANPEQAQTIAARLNTTPFDHFEPLIGEVDAVSVVTPTVHHHRVAAEFLAAGVPALVEKPVCRTVAEADDLIALANKT
jgi:predicted dehydrogenase